MQPTSAMAQILMHWGEVITLLKRLSQRGVSGEKLASEECLREDMTGRDHLAEGNTKL